MREVFPRNEFKRDLRRVARGPYRQILLKYGEFDQVKEMLTNDIPLPPKYCDHPLHGEYEGSRDCHIRPDLVLVYTLEGDDLLILERLGSHTELFGI
ncbi:MAG: type II toxin-antitoxin system YafQ family toxin [Synergistaceae bacterium]|nr:type II toxin-antitoxin system YafQ family toxin [Synergistaceae bacterium]MBR0248617.1 type II toxin-antitoxin system YafQ family toxin [Synergistaceae bacterium]